jgi:oxalate decarboxylase
MRTNGSTTSAARQKWALFLAQGNAVINQFEAGDAGYAPMGAGHYIKNKGNDVCRILVGFNSPHYQAMDLSEWLAGNPLDVLETNLGLSAEVAARLPRKTVYVAPPVSGK